MVKIRNLKELKRTIIYLAAVGISIFLLFFVITSSWIGYEVSVHCQEAQKDFQGDCVEALSAIVMAEDRGFRERNSAIWALGQLGDRRALSVLEAHYTGNIPNREPLDKSISQYELKKAINLASGGFNISAIVWRYGNEVTEY